MLCENARNVSVTNWAKVRELDGSNLPVEGSKALNSPNRVPQTGAPNYGR
jgi:hypothetical protein